MSSIAFLDNDWRRVFIVSLSILCNSNARFLTWFNFFEFLAISIDEVSNTEKKDKKTRLVVQTRKKDEMNVNICKYI